MTDLATPASMADRTATKARRRWLLSEQTADVQAAAGPLHHMNLGPGDAVLGEYAAAGLALPDRAAIRTYRLERVQAQLRERGLAGIILMDPMNIRYATDSTNMQVWVSHNASRYAWVSANGPVIMWDFFECEFLGAHNPAITEFRPARSSIYFIAGRRHEEHARKWAEEMVDVIRQHGGGGEKVAIDLCSLAGAKAIEAAGIELVYGMEVMEEARKIKCDDEIKAMRCSVESCELTMADMRAALQPGMTERELWSMLHAGNIRRGGEWIETQIIASGPRTNPWMQEASSRVIQAGELVAYDTDLVGAYGMMTDISRTWLVGDGRPNAHQQRVHGLAKEALLTNVELLQPGASFRDLCMNTFVPPVDDYRHYCVQFHGVGQCDEYPDIPFPADWDDWGVDDQLHPNMVLTVESYVGPRSGGEGCKLEMQVLVTNNGPERLDRSSLELT